MVNIISKEILYPEILLTKLINPNLSSYKEVESSLDADIQSKFNKKESKQDSNSQEK